MSAAAPKREPWTVPRCIVEYVGDNAVPVSDIELIDTLMPSVARISSATLTYDWADAWVLEMKRKHNLAPSTIRHRHGALARCFDWMLRKHPEIMVQNPLRLLKRGFATYTEADAAALALSGREARVDVERDRRLADGDEAAILEVLASSPVERTFFCLALDTAMRMRECFTLDMTQVSW